MLGNRCTTQCSELWVKTILRTGKKRKNLRENIEVKKLNELRIKEKILRKMNSQLKGRYLGKERKRSSEIEKNYERLKRRSDF